MVVSARMRSWLVTYSCGEDMWCGAVKTDVCTGSVGGTGVAHRRKKCLTRARDEMAVSAKDGGEAGSVTYCCCKN